MLFWSDPNLKRSIELRWLLMFGATWWSCARWSRFTFSCLVVQSAVQSSPPTMCEFLCCLQQSNGPPTHRSPHRRLTFAESYSQSFTSPDVSNNYEIDYVVLLSPNALIWALDSPRRYVLKIHFFIESGRKMIQFKIQFKTKSKIFIQKIFIE